MLGNVVVTPASLHYERTKFWSAGKGTTKPKASYRMVQYEHVYRYTPQHEIKMFSIDDNLSLT